jgi:class III poly(R)-hydroxyalkanoic acid synthase PhaE subunit
MSSSWNKDWLEAQKKYMEVLSSLGIGMPNSTDSGKHATEWQKALDYWWQTSSSSMPEESQSIFSNLLQHSKSWYGFSKQFEDLLNSMSSTDDSNWESVLQDHINKMKAELADEKTRTDNPVESWQNIFETIFSSTDSGIGQFEELQKNLKKFNSLAGFELNENLEKETHEGLQLWAQYKSNLEEYQKTLKGISVKSLDRLQEKIIACSVENKSIESLRALYNLWVDSHEEVYSESVLTEDYSCLYGNMVNSMMAFRAHSQKILSTATSFASSQKTDKQVDLKKELLELKKQQEQDKKHIKLLEDKISKLSTSSAVDVKTAGNSKKTTKKKRAAKKKT